MATPFDKLFSRRTLSPLRENSFSIGQFSYPEDIGSDQHGHFIQFLIYETATRSNLGNTPARRVQNPEVGPSRPPRREQAVATSSRARQSFGAAGRTVRTSDIVTLYMPDNITTTYGLDYENANITAGVLAGSATSGGLGSAIDNISQFDAQSLSNLGADIASSYKTLSSPERGQVAEDIARNAATNVNQALGDVISANLREARNPHMEFLFRGVQQRVFSFDFNFTPKSEEEARRVRRILQLFKKHALPEVRESAAGVFYEYPAEFDILFISNGTENDFLHKISTCALTSIDVNYTGAGINSMHRNIETGDGGRGTPPTHTQVSLQFTELELMSQQRIEQGF